MKKAVIGIDISMDDFHACIKVRTTGNAMTIKGISSFANTDKGFKEFLAWVSKHNKEQSALVFVMEATGVYYENLAYFLHTAGQKVCVVLANKVRSYVKSLNIKTKTDKVDARLIAGLGLERELDSWQPMSAVYKTLRDHCRELLSIKKDLQRAKCQLHSMNRSHEKSAIILQLKGEQVAFYEQAIKLIEREIKSIVDKDGSLKERIRKVQTTPGLGFETIVILACETNGFALFDNVRQVVSYAGLDVSFHESGNFRGKARISKKGNSRIRQALFMPSLSATRANPSIKELYERICQRNPDIKKKGIVAGMRKLLVLTYILWKKDEEYDKHYQWNGQGTVNEETKPSLGHFAEQKIAEQVLAPQ